ncbi:uncharacterized protein METZ01_LOCUS266809, partial [marine metagenome]
PSGFKSAELTKYFELQEEQETSIVYI